MTLRGSITIAAGAAALLTSLGCGRGQTGPATVAITHVTVIDGTGAAPRQDQTPMPTIDSIRASARSGALLAPRIIAAGKMIEAGELCLHIPNDYEYMDEELIERLQGGVAPHIDSGDAVG